MQDVNEFELVVGGTEDTSGLPDSVLNAAKSEAESRGRSGQYVFTIPRSSITPFLQYADSRGLREKLYEAYTNCGTMTTNNHPVIRGIVERREERARILGFESHADFMLDDRMAKTLEHLKVCWIAAGRRVRKKSSKKQKTCNQEFRRTGEILNCSPGTGGTTPKR